MNRQNLTILFLFITLTLAACSPLAAETDDDSGLPPAAVLNAQTWLADRLGIQVEEIEIQTTEQVEWTDSCLELGGPQESCLTVITPGWLVMFEVNGEVFEVHLNEDASIIRLAGDELTPAGPPE